MKVVQRLIRRTFLICGFLLLFLVPAGLAAAERDSPRIGYWTAQAVPSTPFFVPELSFSRLISAPLPSAASFVSHIDGLRSGTSYLLCLPYASGISSPSLGLTDLNPEGGASLAFVAPSRSVDAVATVGAGDTSGLLALRGASIMVLSDASFAFGFDLFLLILFILFLVASAWWGIRQYLLNRAELFGLFAALASVAALAAAAAAFRSVIYPFFETFSVSLEARLRAVSASAFLVSAFGSALARNPVRRSFFLFVSVSVVGAAACAVSLIPFLPPELPSFAFGSFSSAFAVVLAIALLAGKHWLEGLRFLSILFAAAAVAFSSVVLNPGLENFLVCIGAVPFLALSFLRGECVRLVSVPEAEAPVLSDYVDAVSVTLTRFVPKEFLAILNKSDASELRLGDHVKKDMTIFFSDIRSFTNLSEGLTPEENFKFINSYLARVVPVVNNYGGFVDKYIGDAIMALFPDGTGADSAVRAAIEMQKKIVEYNGHRANCGYRPLAMGIGLHTGTLMLGVVGVEDRMQSTVISDAVNLASRLESITKVFNVTLAISEETFKNLEDPGAYMYRFIGKVRVKGKQDPVSVFEIFDGVDESLFERKMKASRFFEQGMLCYYQKDFAGAMYYFRKVLEVLPEDGAAAFYLDNCLAKVQV